MSPVKTYLAYFYKAGSTPMDGWRDRRTVTCDEKGRISKGDYRELYGWVYLGCYEVGKQPKNIWDKAKVSKVL